MPRRRLLSADCDTLGPFEHADCESNKIEKIWSYRKVVLEKYSENCPGHKGGPLSPKEQKFFDLIFGVRGFSSSLVSNNLIKSNGDIWGHSQRCKSKF